MFLFVKYKRVQNKEIEIIKNFNFIFGLIIQKEFILKFEHRLLNQSLKFQIKVGIR